MLTSASQEPSLRTARELLGVTPDADASQLARAYRRQARRLHPDISLEPDATEQFGTLQAAYRLALDAARSVVRPPDSDTRVVHRGRTVVLGDPPRGGGPSTTGLEGRGVAWLVAGPVQVQPPPDPYPGTRTTPSGQRS